MTTTTARTGGVIAAAVAAVSFVVAGATVIGHKVPDEHWGTRGAVLDIAFAVGALAVAAALPALAARLAVGPAGRVGAWIAGIGHVAIAVECLASTVHGGNTLGPVFMLGLLASLVGLGMLAVAGIRSGAARLLAPLPALALVVGIAGGDHGAAIVLGVVWGVLGATIVRSGEPTRAALSTR